MKILKLRDKFLLFCVCFFLVILIICANIYFAVSKNMAKAEINQELIRTAESKKLNFMSSVSSEIIIVKKLADSPIIKSYFEAPTNKNLEKIAFEELASYRKTFKSNIIFWTNDIDKKFYMGNEFSYVVDPDNPDDYWYNMTLYDTQDLNFNINYNPELKQTNLWINAPVFNKNGTPIGMVGSAIVLSDAVSMLYSDMHDSKMNLFLFNEQGEITGSTNISFIENKQSIYSVINEEEVLRKNIPAADGEVTSFDMGKNKAVIIPIPEIKWFLFVYAPITANL